MKKFIIILGVAGTAFSAVLVRYATAPSMVLVIYRMLFSVLILLPSVCLGHRDEIRKIEWKQIMLCVLSGTFLAMYTWIVYFFAGVIVTVFSLMNGTKMIGYGVKNLLVALGLAVLCTLLGHSIFSWGLKFERASFISTVEAAGIKADAFTETEGNPSVETVEKAKEQFLASGADFIVALGGGSPMDVAKAVGVVAKYGGSITEYEGGGKVPGDIIPLIVIPTTAGTGS